MKANILSKASVPCAFPFLRHSLYEGFFIIIINIIIIIIIPVRYEFIHKFLWPFWISF